MKTLTDQLTQYAAYHRDRRNVATHFAGIPMIVAAVAILLARPRLELLGITVSPATLAVVLSAIYYLRLDLRLGAVMTVLLAAALVLAQTLAGASTTVWLSSGIGLFVVGWVLQFIGHWFEGRKPAFVDDIMGLIIGPLFVAAEAGFAFGWRLELQQAIEARLPPAPKAQTSHRSAHS